MSTNTDNTDTGKPSTKMKEPILFNNGTEDYAGIVSFDVFYKFWMELETWVRVMLIECPEERHDSWHKKWESYSKFKLSNPATPPSVPVVLIMEDMQNDYTVLQLIEALTEQIPFLSKHIYFIPADEHDNSVAVKLKLFQSYDYLNPYHQPPYINPKNPFHELAEQTEPPLQVSPGQTVQLVTDADGNPSLAVVGADNTNNETSPLGDPNADIQKDDSSDGSDNGSDNSNKSTLDKNNAPSTN